MNQVKRLTIAAIFALLTLPGTAFATLILELDTLNFSAGNVFTNPLGLGWDLTITGNGAITQNGDGLGVGSGGLHPGENLTFDFDPMAALEGFRIINGSNDMLLYVAVDALGGGTISSPLIKLPNAGDGGADQTIEVMLQAESLSITNFGGSAFRVKDLLFSDAAVAKVAEPSIIALFAVGLLGLGFVRRKV